MDIYELRRLDFIDLRDQIGKGAYKIISDKTGIDPSYLSRCGYPVGKKGKKNISDKIVTELDKAYPGWRKREIEQIGKQSGSAGLTIRHEISEPPAEQLKSPSQLLSQLKGKVTPRSRALLEALAEIDASTGLSEPDIKILEAVIARYETKSIGKHTD